MSAVNIVAPKPPTTLPSVVFQKWKPEARKRLIISVEGLRKNGKTNFALTAPGPIGYMNFDDSLEGVVEKFADKKDIFPFDYKLPFSLALPGTPSGNTLADSAKKVWEKFVIDFREVIKQTRTAVVDTCSESWELIRLARLGKLASVLPHQYVAVNAEFRELLRLASDSDCNLILLHKLKPEYKDDKKTGNYERAGFGDVDFVVQLILRAYKDPKAEGLDQFRMKIAACRHNPLLEGMEFVGEDCDFSKVAAKVTGTEEGEWK